MLVKKEVDGIETAALHCIHTVHDLSGSEGTLVNSNTGSRRSSYHNVSTVFPNLGSLNYYLVAFRPFYAKNVENVERLGSIPRG